jgi:hypothetical protein
MGSKVWQTFLCGICILFCLITLGCSSQPVVTNLALDYQPVKKNLSDIDMSDNAFGISPFSDARDDKVLFSDKRNILMMREEDNPGIWVANAIRLELERDGAQVTPLGPGSRSRTGNFISGRVNVLEAMPYGMPGFGLISVASGVGYSAHINLNVEVLRDGIPVLSQVYDIKKKVSNEALDTYFYGTTPKKTIPKALEIALREMLQTQILPDIDKSLSGF